MKNVKRALASGNLREELRRRAPRSRRPDRPNTDRQRISDILILQKATTDLVNRLEGAAADLGPAATVHQVAERAGIAPPPRLTRADFDGAAPQGERGGVLRLWRWQLNREILKYARAYGDELRDHPLHSLGTSKWRLVGLAWDFVLGNKDAQTVAREATGVPHDGFDAECAADRLNAEAKPRRGKRTPDQTTLVHRAYNILAMNADVDVPPDTRPRPRARLLDLIKAAKPSGEPAIQTPPSLHALLGTMTPLQTPLSRILANSD